ncbi:hypothetical protein AMAG_20285 [Allomyces macrogynus ATCC 38327]|uniref:MyTH4 domain-containing protein n=1 Tax=Allomyces macrogynus (strain ATCC 38327) TaxID=578462 RepID=A0A0L0T951_ALLM3|nr:hypothetical protein AMAG_20285 [Allomyces macrogynus ATCC 38327]|eukprot:KNE71064.1 hypothetical protein AMAG_20285 [Allomyces macrogynus ATCC 38327]
MRRASAGNVPDATALVQDLVVAAPEPEPTETVPSAVAALVGPAAPAPAPLPTNVKPGAVAAANAAAAAANATGSSAPGYGTVTAAIMSGPFPNNAYGTVKLASDAVLGAGAAGGADKANDATAAALNPVHKLTINPLINLRVGDYSMEQYASQYFETKSGSLFGKKKVTLDAKAISYSDSALKKPLTRAAYGDVADTRKAIEMNTMILSFMGDAKIKGVTQLEAAKRMVDAAMSSAALVDEAYCQIIKQLTGHPRAEGFKQPIAHDGTMPKFAVAKGGNGIQFTPRDDSYFYTTLPCTDFSHDGSKGITFTMSAPVGSDMTIILETGKMPGCTDRDQRFSLGTAKYVKFTGKGAQTFTIPWSDFGLHFDKSRLWAVVFEGFSVMSAQYTLSAIEVKDGASTPTPTPTPTPMPSNPTTPSFPRTVERFADLSKWIDDSAEGAGAQNYWVSDTQVYFFL